MGERLPLRSGSPGDSHPFSLSFLIFYSDTVYHVYNQSINFEPIFRSEENYLFFLRKIRQHLLPVADVLCYCLMPDHFHLLLRPSEAGCQPSQIKRLHRRLENPTQDVYQQAFSHQLKIVLSSYTRAINRMYQRRGGLFRSGTKAKPAYIDFAPPGGFPNGVPPGMLIPYLVACFKYIHQNPVKAKLVLEPEDWPYSSAPDYAGIRDGTLCNYQLTEQLLGIRRKI